MNAWLHKNYRLVLWLIPLLSLAMHFHVFKLDLVGIHVWRQTQTQTVINHFYREDMNILNPRVNSRPETDRIFRMEFPIMQWLFALFYKIFGDHIVISRILSFVIGLFSVYGIYYLASGLFKNRTIATLCAWAFNFSPVFYYYTVNPLPDNMALCMGIWSLGLFVRYASGIHFRHLLLSALCLSMAIAAKLPFIAFGAFIGMHLIVMLRKKEISADKFFTNSISYLLIISPALAWYIWVIPTWQGNGIVAGITDDKSGIKGIAELAWGTLISVLPELLINYASVLFFIAAFVYLTANKAYHNKYFPALLITCVAVFGYYFFEINMILLVHDYYLFPFLPFIFLLVGYGAFHLLQNKQIWLKRLAMVAICILPLTAWLRADSRWNAEEPGFNPVLYQCKNEIRALIPANSYCITGNDESGYINLYYLDRKGWSFFNDDLTSDKLSHYLQHGAAYFVSDSRIDTATFVQQHIESTIFEKSDLKIYKLK